jgi:hypothetical protein
VPKKNATDFAWLAFEEVHSGRTLPIRKVSLTNKLGEQRVVVVSSFSATRG